MHSVTPKIKCVDLFRQQTVFLRRALSNVICSARSMLTRPVAWYSNAVERPLS